MPDTQDKRDPLTPDTIRAVRLSMNRRWLAQLEEEFAAMETITLNDLDRLIRVLLELGVSMKALVHEVFDWIGSAQLTSDQLLNWCKAELADDGSRKNIDAEFTQFAKLYLVRRFLAVASASVLN